MTRIRLTVVHRGKMSTLNFSSMPIRLGRDESNECRLEFPFVSRTHARLDLREGRLVVIDSGSHSGTWTCGAKKRRLLPTEAVDLESIGGHFRIGSIVVTAELAGAEPRVETMLAPESSPRSETAAAPDQPPRVETMLAPEDAGAPLLSAAREPTMPSLLGGAFPRLPNLTDAGESSKLPNSLKMGGARDDDGELAKRFLALLEEIEPARIERETESVGGRSPLRFRALWDEYVRRYAEVARRARAPRDDGGASGSDSLPPDKPRGP
jgi:pSer/pThr/pTyr-binding forkhead associated (FHA) protein